MEKRKITPNTPINVRDVVPFEDYAPYYEIATSVLEQAIDDLKKMLKHPIYNQRKIAEMYVFYNSDYYTLFSRNMCDYKEHLERRGIKEKELKYMEEQYEKYKCAKKNVKDGFIIKYRPTGDFYIKIDEYLMLVDVKSATKTDRLSHMVSAYGTHIYNQYGDCIWQTEIEDDKRTYTSQLVIEQVRNGYTFVIKNMDDSRTIWTKQGKCCYVVKQLSHFLFQTINDEDIEEIFKNGVKNNV